VPDLGTVKNRSRARVWACEWNWIYPNQCSSDCCHESCLAEAIAAGTFRSDLFYRLNVFPVGMHPPWERREDIPVPDAYFIDRFARNAGESIRGVHKQTLELLQSPPWPRNIREL
jgi:transcriptional regulator with PAS, ATPase and Fis domain